MSNYTTLKTLFTALHGSLPYEYDEKYIDAGPSIAITKGGTDRTIYITANTPDDNGVFDAGLYDDDDLIEIYQWDTNDPNLNLLDLIAYIEKSL